MTYWRIALAQINVLVGDIEGNVHKIEAGIQQAREVGADLVVFPELAVTGYPPEDLLLKPAFLQANMAAVLRLARATQGITAIVGFADVDNDVYNAAAILHDGEWVRTYRKHYLPNYAVFDEDRYFRKGTEIPVFERDGVAFGVSICEDIWYPAGPPEVQALQGGARLLVNISASPYHAGKLASREQMLITRATDNAAVVAFCNLVGGQDELVFDGSSVIVNERGQVLARGAQFAEDFIVADVDLGAVFRWRLHDPRWRKATPTPLPVVTLPVVRSATPLPARQPCAPHIAAPLPPLAEIYQALVLGVRDYIRKNGFKKVVIGLSGGIDSSLVACIAVDALGPENVVGVAMPSRYTAEMSNTDAAQLATNLGIGFMTIPIESVFQAYLDVLAGPFAGTTPGVAEENIQARIRGNYLMALSNKFGWLVLTTGNKSEMSAGYATLYGDMAGGYAVIKDVLKTLVYDLANWRNAQGDAPVIPERCITRPPSAELRPDQKDTDSLPPYEVLDAILKAYVEDDQSPEDIVATLGLPEDVVRRVARMVDRNEYKRRQAPPGVRITARAFGKDRRLPITQRFVSTD
ncbi:MAG TPA: NAD+ synthase [Anaerolineae bacterium]|nr:NAD+ synthase [Anaerolineae bacterium]HQK13149.1 NAD+ synthase [Anaerolineae bacterium]